MSLGFALIMIIAASAAVFVTAESVVAATIDDPSLLAWYTFEADKLTAGTSGNRLALDSSGKGNDATMYWSDGNGTFATVANGAEGASLSFNNGTRTTDGAYLQLPPALLKDTDSFTVSMWYKLSGAPANARLFNFDTVAAGGTRGAYIAYTPYGNATVVEAVVESRASASATAARMPFTGSRTTGEWNHLVVTRDSKATRVYMNGSLYAQGAAGLSPRGLDFLGAYLGRSGSTSNNFFDGEMDDVRIYNRLFTPRDAMNQYKSSTRVASLNTTPGAYLMSYTLPSGFSGYGGSTTATPLANAVTQVGIFDYSLHYAYSEDGKTWLPLNDNRGILYWFGDVSMANTFKYLNPRIVNISGTYNLYGDRVANADSTATAGQYLRWTSPDMVTWTQQAGVTTVPTIPANPAGIDLTGKPFNANVGNVIAITSDQLTAIKNAYDTPHFDEVNLTAYVGEPIELPNYGTISPTYGDPVNYGHSVTWSGVPDFTKPGVYEIVGTVNYDYTNPYNTNGADPQIYYHDGWYYFTGSWMDDSYPPTPFSLGSYTAQGPRTQYMGVTIRRARTLAGLVTTQTAKESREAGFYPQNPNSQERAIFWKSNNVPGWSMLSNATYGSAHNWAPEIHRVTIDGKSTWIVVWALSAMGNDSAGSRFTIQTWISVCDSDDPWTGNWAAPVYWDDGSPTNFDLDATILEHSGDTYICWASSRQTNSRNWIAKMTSPTTINTAAGNQVMIAMADYSFENRNDRVVEGATFMKANGKIWKSYSCGSTNANYNMGLMWAIDSPSTNVMSRASWTEYAYPIMHSDRAAVKFGPGHAAFEYDYNGAGGKYPILSYHARSNEDYGTGHNPAPLYSPTRQANIAPVYFRNDGSIYVGPPPANGQIPAPPIYGTITVVDSTDIRLTPANLTLKSAAEGYASAASGVFTITNPSEETKTVALTLSDANFTLNSASVTVPAGGTATFAVTPVVGLTPNVYSGAVTVMDDDVVRTAAFSFRVLEKAADRYVNTSFDLLRLEPSAESATTSYITNANETERLAGYVYQALYDGDRMIKLASNTFDIAPGTTSIVKTALTLPDVIPAGYKLKCFVWDSDYVPICQPAVFSSIARVELPEPLIWYEFNSGGSATGSPIINSGSLGTAGNGVLTNGTAGGTPTYSTAGGVSYLRLNSSGTATRTTGTADWFNAPISSISGKNNVTFSLRTRNIASSTSFQNRFTFAIQQLTGAGTSNYYLGLNTTYGNRVFMKSNNTETVFAGSSSSMNNTNVWEHYTISVNTSGSTAASRIVTVYKNGELFGSGQASAGQQFSTFLNNATGGAGIEFGRSSWNADNNAQADYADFRIYDGALNAAQAKELYNQVYGVSEPRLPAGLVSDHNALALSRPTGSTLTANLGVLPSAGANGSTITWGATNPVYLNVNGNIYRPNEEEGDQIAVLVATLTAPTGEKVTKAFIYYLETVSDSAAVIADAAELQVLADLARGATAILHNDFEADAILPVTGSNGSTITWNTSDPAVMTASGKNLVSNLDVKPVTLTATITKGVHSLTKEFELVCKTPYYGYLLSYFIGNAAAQQQFFLATSPDSNQWTWLNNNTKVIDLTGIGEAAARDPFIIKHPYEQMYYMLATDLNSSKSSISGWRALYGYPTTFSNTWGNKAILVYESANLIDWTLTSRTDFRDNPTLYPYTNNFGNAWAPEAIWVEDHNNGDGTTGAFMMFWSGSVDPNRTGYTDYNHAICAFTKDFKTFTNPQALYNIAQPSQWIAANLTNATIMDQQLIDGTIVWDPFISRWHFYFRLGRNSLSRTERVTSVGTKIPSSTAEWTDRTRIINQAGWEGGCFHKMIGIQEWRMIIDGFGTSPNRFAMYRTTDFVTHTEIPAAQTNINANPLPGAGGRVRHGTIIPIPRDRYEELIQKAPAGSWRF